MAVLASPPSLLHPLVAPVDSTTYGVRGAYNLFQNVPLTNDVPGNVNQTNAFNALVTEQQESGATLGARTFDFMVPPRRYVVDTIQLNSVNSTIPNKISFHGSGQSSLLVQRQSTSAASNTIELSGSGSFSTNISDLRFETLNQLDNIQSAAIASLDTVLDFQYHDMYINGVPRGITGNHVSGQINGIIFDFMTDYGIYSATNQFRKIEMYGLHFYKTKDKGLYLQGQFTSDGVTSVTPTIRNNAVGMGHFNLTASGFDRYMETTVAQDFIDLDSGDNFSLGDLWFNGKTPNETDTGTNEFMWLKNCDNFTVGTVNGYYADGGYRFERCTNFNTGIMTIRKGNLAGVSNSGTMGAVVFSSCAGFHSNVVITSAGGTGLLVSGSDDWEIHATVKYSQLAGVLVTRCDNWKLHLTVVDANMADSTDGNGNSGLIVTGTTAVPSTNGQVWINGTLTDLNVGQRYHAAMGANALNMTLNGDLGPGRTGYSRLLVNMPELTLGQVRGINVGVSRGSVFPATNLNGSQVYIQNPTAGAPRPYWSDGSNWRDSAGVTLA